MTPNEIEQASGENLEARIAQVGEHLGSAFARVLEALPMAQQGPQVLAKGLGLDKVLTSRLLKALRRPDPMSVLHSIPGPEPLRRLLKAARRQGLEASLLANASEAVTEFEHLIKSEVGDRSALGAIISAWLPEAREEFELRRKQAAYKAMSQLKGTSADMNLSAVFLHPGADGKTIDVVWLIGQLGLRRLRPGVTAKFATRRMVSDDMVRRPTTLSGEPIEGLDSAPFERFCALPPARLDTHRYGDVVHYTLSGEEFGPRSAVDLLFAEVNLGEVPRFVPVGSGRKGYVFSEVSVPCRTLVLDVLVHDEIYPGSDPDLAIYDTSLNGVADVNERARDIDRLDMVEGLQSLGRGTGNLRIAEVPRHIDSVRHVYAEMGWDEAQFRSYRCRVDYPIYGSQVSMAFLPPASPEA